MPDLLTAALEVARKRIGTAGLAAGLRRADGTEVYATCGNADLDSGLAMDSAMAFPAGSIIKPCIGTLALQLAAQGALSLDDPLHRWVPEFIGTGDLRSEPSPATLRQVLTHTAGIKCFTELLYWLPYPLQVHNASRRWSDADALAIANHYPPYFAPGAGFHYSNCGYALLGLALERAASAAAGRPVGMEELLRERVCEPLGIAAVAVRTGPAPSAVGTGVSLSADAPRRVPIPDTLTGVPNTGSTRYIRYDPPQPNTQALPDTPWPALQLRGYMKPEHGGHDVTKYETYSLYGPAGALLSSLPDLLRLSASLFPAGAEQCSAILSSGLAEAGRSTAPPLLQSVPADGPGKRYGLGVQIFERDWAGGVFYGHGGNVMGTSSGMWHFPARGLHLAFVANRALAWERPIFEALLGWADREFL